MSETHPIFIQQFERSHTVLQTLAAQEFKAFSKELSPDAKDMLAREHWEKAQRMIGMIREVSIDMGKALQTIKDLQLAKHPDIERVAQDIWVAAVAVRTKDPMQAFDAARSFIKYRNEQRAKEV